MLITEWEPSLEDQEEKEGTTSMQEDQQDTCIRQTTMSFLFFENDNLFNHSKLPISKEMIKIKTLIIKILATKLIHIETTIKHK
jgi:hypothetical protein